MRAHLVPTSGRRRVRRRTVRLGTAVAASGALALAVLPATATAATRSDSPAAAPDSGIPGSTHTLPYSTFASRGPDAARTVQPFSLIGLTWNDPETELHADVAVRVRSTRTGHWSGWQAITPGDRDDGPDAAERDAPGARGGSAPLWVGASDALRLRVTPERGRHLPDGLRVDMVDPGEAPSGQGDAARTAGDAARTVSGAAAPAADPAAGTHGAAADLPQAARPPQAPKQPQAADLPQVPHLPQAAELPAMPERPSLPDLPEEARPPWLAHRWGDLLGDPAEAPEGSKPQGAAPAKGVHAARPHIVSRKGWHADEHLREKKFAYTRTVKAVFVHHTATGNNYSCKKAPAVIRGMYRYHVKSNGWRDIGYNFLVDKCGTIYEGRAGGVAKPVLGAHTLGFNTDTTGVAAIGTYSKAKPPAKVLDALARLSAWKLGLTGARAKSTVVLTSSSNGARYKKGHKHRFQRISGHRDGFATECPGKKLYADLGTIRNKAAALQK